MYAWACYDAAVATDKKLAKDTKMSHVAHRG